MNKEQPITFESIEEIINQQNALMNSMLNDPIAPASEMSGNSQLAAGNSRPVFSLPEEQVNGFFESFERMTRPKATLITEEQTHALNRKHLLLIIKDLQEKYDMLAEEHERVLKAIQTGCTKTRQINEAEYMNER